MKFKTFDQTARVGHVERVLILSNEGDIYTVQAVIAGRAHTLERDDQAQPLVFHSYIEAKRRFAAAEVPVVLKPSEVYDEMVGRPVLH